MVEIEKDFIHLKPAGRICLGEKLVDFQNMIIDTLKSGHSRIILDLIDVSYIDSSGIGEILKLFLEAREKSRDLVLTNLPSGILKIFQNAKLDAVFNITDTLDEAKKM